MKNPYASGEYDMDRLQTDFENAWQASSKAVEGIALLLLSLVIAGLEGCLKAVVGLYRWIEHSAWLIPGKQTTWK
jgi:hypothetical protein